MKNKKRVRQYNFPEDFVLHSLRHTCLTRLGEAAADAFTIMKLAGHSSVTVSQRYVHPTPESVEGAFDRLETLNSQGSGTGKWRRLPTKSPTARSKSVVSYLGACSSTVRAGDS